MNILVLGSGGREHAISWKISQSEKCSNLYIAPGNAGTELVGKNLSVNINDFKEVKLNVIEKSIDLVIVGPEEPLVRGIVDFFKSDDELKHVKIFGPSSEGSKLEGSKDFSKEFMFRNNIPCAKSKTFNKNNLSEGISFLEKINPPYVLKADGLAAGKGVLILDDLEEAKTELSKMILDEKFGDASKNVLIEEYLDGIEVSVFAITDGHNYIILPEAKDYKRIGEGDTGLNTGGMGAVSPVDFADNEFMKKVEDSVIKRTVNGMKKEKLDYEIIKTPMFLSSRQDFKLYLSKCKKPFMANFYKEQRVKHDILVNKDKSPKGGKWSFDNENRKNSLLWVKFEEEVYDLYEKREFLLKEKVDDVNIKIELKKIEDFIKEKKHNMLAGLFIKIRKMSA